MLKGWVNLFTLGPPLYKHIEIKLNVMAAVKTTQSNVKMRT